MAQSVGSFVEESVRETLTAAVRAHQHKALAARYGIIGVDPRNVQQIRAAAAMISVRMDCPRAIPDAIELVQHVSSFNVSALLSRALVHRATNALTHFADEYERDKTIQQALAFVPQSRLTVVVEDAVACLVGMIDELCGSLSSTLGEMTIEGEKGLKEREKGLKDREKQVCDDKNMSMILCRSAICITSHYLDEKRGLRGLSRSPTATFDDDFGRKLRCGMAIARQLSDICCVEIFLSNNNNNNNNNVEIMPFPCFPNIFHWPAIQEPRGWAMDHSLKLHALNHIVMSNPAIAQTRKMRSGLVKAPFASTQAVSSTHRELICRPQ